MKPTSRHQGEAATAAWKYSFFNAIVQRRSRRFPLGATIAGATHFQSSRPPIALDDLEEALLVMAAQGLSGITLPDDLLGGNHDYTLQFSGRTHPSPCASYGTHLFLSNDRGVFLSKPVETPPPQTSPESPAEMWDGVVERYRSSLHRISDTRLEIPMAPPVTNVSNQWALNKPGTTLFMPVTDVTREYINLLFLMLDAPNCKYIYDDLNGNAEPLAKYVGPGMLDKSRAVPLSRFESDVLQCTAAAEQTLMLQNIFLAVQCIGLGGWILSTSDPFVVFGGSRDTKGLGFRFFTPEHDGPLPPPDFVGRRAIPVGLEGHIEPACPPWYPNMTAAVRAIIDQKWSSDGSYQRGAKTLREDLVCTARVPQTSDWCQSAVVDLCEYIFKTYGCFPARMAPVQMSAWFQAHHLETGYYDAYYQPGSYHEAIRNHMDVWHGSSSEIAP